MSFVAKKNKKISDAKAIAGREIADIAESAEQNVNVVRLHQSHVHFAKPVVSRKVPVEAIQAVSVFVDALVMFCAALLLLPVAGLSQILGAAGLSLVFVIFRAVKGGYSRSVVRKTP